jgi:hypothetical protein
VVVVNCIEPVVEAKNIPEVVVSCNEPVVEREKG